MARECSVVIQEGYEIPADHVEGCGVSDEVRAQRGRAE